MACVLLNFHIFSDEYKVKYDAQHLQKLCKVDCHYTEYEAKKLIIETPYHFVLDYLFTKTIQIHSKYLPKIEKSGYLSKLDGLISMYFGYSFLV